MGLGEDYKKSKEGRIANGTVFGTTWKNSCGFIVSLKPNNTKTSAIQPFSHDGKCKPLTRLPCLTCLILILNSVLYEPCEL